MKLALGLQQKLWAPVLVKDAEQGRVVEERAGAPVRTSYPNSVTAPGHDHTLTPDAELRCGTSGQPQTSQVQATPISLARSSTPSRPGPQIKSTVHAAAQQSDPSISKSDERRRERSDPAHTYGRGDLSGHEYQRAGHYLPGKDTVRRPLGSSPDKYRRPSSLNQVPEEMEPTQLSSMQSNGEPRFYGSVGHGSTPSNANRHGDNFDTLSYDEESELSEQEEDWLLDEELAMQGLYRGNYKVMLSLYSLVPLTSLLAFVSLALIPIFAFPSKAKSAFPYPPYLPYPLPEVLTSTALWSLAYLLRDPLYTICLFLTSLIPFPTYRFPSVIPFLASSLSAVSQSTVTLFLRQLAVPILLVPYYSTERFQPHDAHTNHFPTWRDDAFRRVWWIALGWAMAEAVVGIKQGYENIYLYKDVLVNVRKDIAKSGLMRETITPTSNQREHTPSNGRGPQDLDITPRQENLGAQHGSTPRPPTTSAQQERPRSSSRSPPGFSATYHRADDFRAPRLSPEAQPLLGDSFASNQLSRQVTRESDRLIVENEVERDLEELMMIKNREDLEEIYGMPVIRIPVFLSCLHHINSILSSLGTTLLLTAAYMRSTFAYAVVSPSSGSVPPPSSSVFKPSNKYILVTFPVLLAVHSILTLMHTPWILPRLGIHTFVYIGLLVSLGLFFGGLGVWEVLM